MSYVAQTVTYPLSVTSTVMAVNGARIKGGRPPFMVIYGGWYSCLKDLHKQVPLVFMFPTPFFSAP